MVPRRRLIAVVGALMILVACSGGGGAGTTSAVAPTSASQAPTSTSSSTVATTVATTQPVTSMAETTTTADHNLITSGTFEVPFTMHKPESMAILSIDAAPGLRSWGRRNDTEWLIFGTGGFSTIDDWLHMMGSAVADSPEHRSEDLGGVEAAGVDVEVHSVVTLFQIASGGFWGLAPTEKARIYVAEVDGTPVSIVIESERSSSTTPPPPTSSFWRRSSGEARPGRFGATFPAHAARMSRENQFGGPYYREPP